MDNEDLYHYDFTTASELEIFIARLEEIIHEWKLPQKPLDPPLSRDIFKTGEWCSVSETLTFADAEFQLTRYYLKYSDCNETSGRDNTEVEDGHSQAISDMMSMENDFFPISFPPSKSSHPIARWYGLRDFLVLVPQHSINVASESKVKVLISSLYIAVGNTGCPVPFFIQAQEPWQCYFLGICHLKGYKTEFQMVHLKRTPLHCKYLTGLLTLFKTKIGSGMLTGPVTVSVRFTYVLRDWTSSIWTQEPPDFDFLGGEMLGVSELGSLPFGSAYDPIGELYLSATWPCLLENSVVDGESYSDLEPMQAPTWTVQVNTVDNLSCLLTEYFSEFVLLNRNKHTTTELLGPGVDSSSSRSNSISSPLNILTESKISALSKAVMKTDRRGSRVQVQERDRPAEGPISADVLMMLLYFLFPDADSESKSPYPEYLTGHSTVLADEKVNTHIDERLNGMKSAQFNSLPWRLAVVMAHVVHSLGGARSAAHLWYEVTQELRFRWENGILIPGLENVFPDPRTCLLNQKLQLINCCISRRIAREKRASRPADEESDSDVDEFFDCSSDAEGEEEPRRRKVKHAPWDQPTGRLARHGELKLLESGEYLYIPVTQDPVPKTEDQLEEDAEMLLQLGTDAQGSELRARLMSASLLSDMEAFKAANPGCILEDFIRWYSPRDWIQDEGLDEFGQANGHLSNRMKIPGNTWLEVWQVAKPVPAKWQRRLFNDTREAEKALNFLESKSPREFIELLLPVMTTCVIYKLLEEAAVDELPGVPETLTRLIKKAERFGRMSKIIAKRYEELINDISAIETLLVQVNSLKHKFLRSLKEEGENASYPEFLAFIKSLLTNSETEVPGGSRSGIGATIRSYFAEASKADQLIPDQSSRLTEDKWNVISPFPTPCEKEFILRCGSLKGSQRLHAVLKKNEYRLCGAFTSQDTFI